MIGLFLFSRSGIHLLWIGLIGVASTYFYYLLKYRALGDLLIFIIYGQLLPLGTVYVTTGLLDYHMLLISAPIGLLVVNILHANNTRDIRFDKMANIRTLAMWMGIENAKKQYTLLYIASYIGIVVLVLLKALPIACLLSLATLPLAIKNIQRMRLASAEHPEHIKTLDANSAQLLLVFSLLLSLSNVATKFLS